MRKATLLAAPDRQLIVAQRHVAEKDGHQMAIALGDTEPGRHVNVLRLDLDGAPDVNSLPCQQPDGSIHLPAYLAALHVAAVNKPTAGAGVATDTAAAAENFNLAAAKAMKIDVAGVVQNWFDAGSHVAWEFAIDTPGEYQLELRTFARKYSPWVGGHCVQVACNGHTLHATLTADTEPDTASRQYFNETGSLLGTLRLDTPGTITLTLQASTINPADPVGLAVSQLILQRLLPQYTR